MFFAILGLMYTVFVAGLAWLVHSVKSLSTMLDKRASAVDNEQFLRDFGFRMKLNAYFEKIWPVLRFTKLESVADWTYRVSIFGFVLIFLMLWAFPKVVNLAGVPLFFALGILSVVGSALRPNMKVNKIASDLLIPFCVISPLFIVYQLDNLEQGRHLKHAFSQLPFSYSVALLGFSFTCSVIAFIAIRLLERFQSVFVIFLLDRTLLLAQRLVAVGVLPTLPLEVEMRAIAKDAITATVASLTLFGVVVGALATLVKIIYNAI